MNADSITTTTPEGALEGAMPLSSDPEKRARQLANLAARPPAPPAGNVRALVHGGRARQATLVRAGSWGERIYRELEAEAPLRADDGTLPVHDRQVELLASALARLEAVEAWLATRPALDEKGKPWPAEDVAARLRREVARGLDAMGMTPTSRARLGLDLTRTADLASLMAADAEAEAAERGDVVDGQAHEATRHPGAAGTTAEHEEGPSA